MSISGLPSRISSQASHRLSVRSLDIGLIRLLRMDDLHEPVAPALPVLDLEVEMRDRAPQPAYLAVQAMGRIDRPLVDVPQGFHHQVDPGEPRSRHAQHVQEIELATRKV